MGQTINRLTNANAYINGSTLLGKVEEIQLPDIKAVMTEHKALGQVGKVEFPSGFDKLEAKIKWNSFYADEMKQSANFYQSVQMQLRSSIEGYEGTTRASQKPYVVFMTCQFKNIPAGNFKAMDNAEFESNLSVTAIRIEVDGSEVLNFDAMANIYSIDGVDQLAEYRNNLGL